MLCNIQALRALAAFLVVFVHLKPLFVSAGWPVQWLDFGNCGVDVFFLISGLIMVVTTQKRPHQPATFLAHRVARVVPFYWLVTGMVIAVALVRPSLMGATRIDPPEILKSLAFIPYRKPNGLTEPIAFVGWTLNYEMVFYCLFAASMFIRNRAIGLGLTVAVIALDVVWGFWANPHDTLGAFYSRSLVGEFAIGMLLGAGLNRLPRSPAARTLAMILIGPAFIAMIAGAALQSTLDRLAFFGAPATVLVACALVLERSGVVIRNPWVKRLGDASYSMYLSHVLVTQLVIKAAQASHLHSPLGILALFPPTLAMTGVVGLLVFRWVETPITAWARRWIQPAPTASLASADIIGSTAINAE